MIPKKTHRNRAAARAKKITTAVGRLHGKVALITGASQGIGLAIAEALAVEGCHLVITGRDQSRLNKAAGTLGTYKGRILPVVCDVRDAGAVKALFAKVRAVFTRIDVLINNAGVSHGNFTMDKLPVEAWRMTIETNLTGAFLMTRAALPLMKRGGMIVNNLSVASRRVFAGSSAYSASKQGALAFTSSLREELRPRGIRVMALLAGATDTAIWTVLWPEAPRQKMMSASDVAQALVDAVNLPPGSVVEHLTILPIAGTL